MICIDSFSTLTCNKIKEYLPLILSSLPEYFSIKLNNKDDLIANELFQWQLLEGDLLSQYSSR